MTRDAWLWCGFLAFVLVMLLLDLMVFHRKAHEIKFKEALGWTIFWVALGVAFSGVVYWEWGQRDKLGLLDSPAAQTQPAGVESHVTADRHEPPSKLKPTSGRQAAVMYLTGYVLEQALSMDNLFVMLLIFGYFKVPAAYQHRVLFWGIIGAQVMRAAFILAGVELIDRFHWIIYIFGAFLVFTGIKMMFKSDEEMDPSKNWVLRLTQKILPVSHEFDKEHFFVRHAGKLVATPLFVALIVVESTDVVFAVDSIPAILAITNDKFIAFSSNILAILGLRAMYFALAGFIRLFAYLGYGLAIILIFIGVKMLGSPWFHFDEFIALGVIAAILALSVAASLIWPPKETHAKTA